MQGENMLAENSGASTSDDDFPVVDLTAAPERKSEKCIEEHRQEDTSGEFSGAWNVSTYRLAGSFFVLA